MKNKFKKYYIYYMPTAEIGYRMYFVDANNPCYANKPSGVGQAFMFIVPTLMVVLAPPLDSSIHVRRLKYLIIGQARGTKNCLSWPLSYCGMSCSLS